MTIVQPLQTRCLLCRPCVSRAHKLLQHLAEADPVLKSRAFMCTFRLHYCEWEVPHFSPKSTAVFLAEEQHPHRVCQVCFSSCSAESIPESVSCKLSCCAVEIKHSCPRGTPRAPITYSPPKPPLCSKRNKTMLGTWQKTFLKGRNNLTATPSHLWPSGGVVGWLSGSKNLTPKEKNFIFCEDAEHL